VNVCAYCRVSTNAKDQENSFENQKAFFEREIAKNRDYNLYKIFADRGISGTSLTKREEFNNLLWDAGLEIEIVERRDELTNRIRKEYIYHVTDREPLFNLIFVKNTSRFARNILVWDIIRKLKQKGVFVYFLDICKSTENTADEMLIQFLMTIDENDSKDKSKKVKFGMEEAKIKGNILTNIPSYGYDYKDGEFLINEEEAKNVRTIFELYTSGLGTRKLVRKITEMGIRTKKGKEFNISTIRLLLKNEKYVGTLIRNRWDNGEVFHKHGPKQKDKSEWLIFEDKIPRIISDELFQRAQDILESRHMMTGKAWEKKKGFYEGMSPYASKIFCGKCGSKYISRGQYKEEKKFYNCTKRQKEGREYCNNPNVLYSVLDAKIGEYAEGGYFAEMRNIELNYFSILDNIKLELLNNINRDNIEQVNSLKTQLKGEEEKVERILDLYVSKLITKEQFEKRTSILQEGISNLNIEIEKLTRTYDETIKKLGDIDALKESIRGKSLKRIYTREEIMNELDGITVIERDMEDETAIRNRRDAYILEFNFKKINKLRELIAVDNKNNYVLRTISHMLYCT